MKLYQNGISFQIEREVILSSTDKNSKIPILHDYKKRTKAVVAPDIPPKQMAAWTLSNGQTLSPDQVGLFRIQLHATQKNQITENKLSMTLIY